MTPLLLAEYVLAVGGAILLLALVSFVIALFFGLFDGE
jgi:hypothetical protein